MIFISFPVEKIIIPCSYWAPFVPPDLLHLRIVLSPEQTSRMWVFLNISVLQGGVVSTSLNPQARGPPLVGCPRLLIQFIRSYPL